jgi:hypothetical protein
MHAMLFTVVFQGLALWAFFCLAKAIMDLARLKANSLHTALHHITSPALALTGLITPAIIPASVHLFLAAFWLLVVRVAFYMGAAAYGLLPVVTP